MQTRSLEEARLLTAWRKAPAIAKDCALQILTFDQRHAADHQQPEKPPFGCGHFVQNHADHQQPVKIIPMKGAKRLEAERTKAR